MGRIKLGANYFSCLVYRDKQDKYIYRLYRYIYIWKIYVLMLKGFFDFQFSDEYH